MGKRWYLNNYKYLLEVEKVDKVDKDYKVCNKD